MKYSKHILLILLLTFIVSCSTNKAPIILEPNTSMPRDFKNKKSDFTLKKIDYYVKQIKEQPQKPLPYYNLGVFVEKQEKYKEAITCYKKSLFLDSSLSFVHYNIASLYLKTGGILQAFKHLSIADSLEPMAYDILNNLELAWYKTIVKYISKPDSLAIYNINAFLEKFPRSRFRYSILLEQAHNLKEKPLLAIKTIDTLLTSFMNNQFNSRYIKAEAFYLKGIMFMDIIDSNIVYADSALVSFDSSASYKTDRLFMTVMNIQNIYKIKANYIRQEKPSIQNEIKLQKELRNISNTEIKYAILRELINKKNTEVDKELLSKTIILELESLDRLLNLLIFKSKNLISDTTSEFEKDFIEYQTNHVLSVQIINISSWISKNFEYLKDLNIVSKKLSSIFIKHMNRWREEEAILIHKIIKLQTEEKDYWDFIYIHTKVLISKGSFSEGLRLLFASYKENHITSLDKDIDYNSKINSMLKLATIEKKEIIELKKDIEHLNTKIENLKQNDLDYITEDKNSEFMDNNIELDTDEIPEPIIINISE